MAEQEDNKQPSPIDEETLKSIQNTLYDRLREPLLLEIRERLMEEAAEQPIPLYYDRFIASQIQRLEEAIERNTQRIVDLQREMERRFEEVSRHFTEQREEMDRRFEEVSRRFTEQREEMDRRFEEVSRRFTEQREEIDRRFTEQQEEMDHRFTEAKEEREAIERHLESIDRRFEALNTRLDEMNVRMRNWTLAAVALISLIVTILQMVLR